MQAERRNLTLIGRRRRGDFDRSLVTLHELGMPDWAVEYYRRAARVASVLPHQVVMQVAVITANRQLEADPSSPSSSTPPIQ